MLALYFFLTQAAAGSLLAMIVVPVRAAGKLYFRFGAALAASVIALALGAAWWGGGAFAGAGSLAAGGVALLVAAGLFHVERAPIGLGALLAGMIFSIAGVGMDAWLVLPPETTASAMRLRFLLDGLSGGLVTGSVTMAMVLGHYYLNIPGLPSRHLERLTLLCMAALGARAVILGTNLAIHRSVWLPLAGLLAGGDFAGDTALDPFAAVLLLLQVLAGILVPFVFCLMAWRSAKIASTQSATGILYVALIVVMMGELAGRSLVAMTRLPL